MKRYASNTRIPMLPTGSRSNGTGLLEKRVNASSGLGLVDSVSLIGDRNLATESPLYLSDAANWHNNHGSDPGTDNLALSDSVGLNMSMLRPVETVMALTDYAHACLCGYTPGGGGVGPTYDPSYALTANETVLIGQPVYISDNSTINLADASDLTASRAIGLVSAGASASGTANVMSDNAVTQPNWTAVTGSVSLTPGATYFLGSTPGTMTTTPPTADGSVVVTLGTALTTTKFDIEVNEVAIL